MKKYLYLIGCALAAVAVSACSREETPTEETTPEVLNGTSFMGITLTMSGGSSTRTNGNGQADTYENQTFVAGSDAENAINAANALFLFYDGVGNFVAMGQIDTDDDAVDPQTGNLIFTASKDGQNSVTNATVILGPTKTFPSQVLAILNCSGSVRQHFLTDQVSLADAYDIVTSAIPSAAGSFVMANSMYLNTSNSNNYSMVIGQPIATSQIKPTKDEAKASPVIIHVEREIAKVRIQVNGNNISQFTSGDHNGKYYQVLQRTAETTEADVPSILDNNTASPTDTLDFRVVIDGWTVNATNPSGYVVKNYIPSWENTTGNNFLTYNDTTHHRSYWAADMNYTGEVGDYDAQDGEGTGTYQGLQMKSWNDVVNAASPLNTAEVYYHENTVPRASQANSTVGGGKTNVPALLVAAHLEYRTAATKTAAAGEWIEFTDDMFYSNQNYMTRRGLRENIAQYLNLGGYRWISNDNTDTLAVESADFTVTYGDYTGEGDSDNNGRVVATAVRVAKDGYTLYLENTPVTLDANGNNAAMVDYINGLTLIANGTGLVVYRGGACYYQMPIRHWQYPDDVGNGYLYGIVRNHVYRITIDSFSRIGGPIANKDIDLPVIPGESEDYYIAARLEVLNWVLKTQTVQF